MRTIKSAIKMHIFENKKHYLAIVATILLGFVLGSLLIGLDSDLNLKGQANLISFWNSLKLNVRFWILITLGGLFIQLKVLIFIANFLKGFSIGFMIKLVLHKYALKGVLLILISNLFHIILFLPIAIYFSVCAMNIKDKKKWLYRSAIFGAIIVFFACFDGFIIPVFIGGLLRLF
jgi:hypothetical protein